MPVVNGYWQMPHRLGRAAFGVPAPLKGKGGEDVWRKEDIDAACSRPMYLLTVARGIGMDVEQHAVEVNGEAEKALLSLKETLDKFRGHLANDLTSIKAAAGKVQSETAQMKQAYLAAQSLLTSPEFERAIANAERMAAALKSISALSETKLSVAVFSGNNKQA